MSIEVRNISKTFGRFAALRDVSLKVEAGELLALLGPSGSGKTTLLRIIAGLESPDAGSGPILFHEEDVAARDVGSRRVGFVFQHYALFRHMSVFENVAFGLRARPWRERPRRSEIRDRVMKLLGLVQLESLERRYPSQLSGGQRQRVALARALAVEPKVLLLDEPFGALDAKVRRELRRWLRHLHDEVGITSVFVTHDQEEALEVANRVAVMNKGRIEQIGTPEDVYDNPANAFVYNFLGNVNLFHGRVEDGRLVTPGEDGDAGEHERAATSSPRDGATLPAVAAALASSNGKPGKNGAVTYVRPHDVQIFREADGEGTIAARVDHVGFAGAIVNVSLERLDDKSTIDAELTRDHYKQLGIKPTDTVWIALRNARTFADDYSI